MSACKITPSGYHVQSLVTVRVGAGQVFCLSARDCLMPKRILVVDDNPMIRRLICRLLEEQAGYEVCAQAADGAEAIELAKKEMPTWLYWTCPCP
jgi:PleD family two-component response regulator